MQNIDRIKQISDSRVGSVAQFLIHTISNSYNASSFAISTKSFINRFMDVSKPQHLGTCKH